MIIPEREALAHSRSIRLVLALIRATEDPTFDAQAETERIMGELDCVQCLYMFTLSLVSMLSNIVAAAEGETDTLVTQLEDWLKNLLDALETHHHGHT